LLFAFILTDALELFLKLGFADQSRLDRGRAPGFQKVRAEVQADPDRKQKQQVHRYREHYRARGRSPLERLPVHRRSVVRGILRDESDAGYACLAQQRDRLDDGLVGDCAVAANEKWHAGIVAQNRGGLDPNLARFGGRSFLELATGRSTFTPSVKSGAVTMKITSNTNITSM
jgi:hypothetical protein